MNNNKKIEAESSVDFFSIGSLLMMRLEQLGRGTPGANFNFVHKTHEEKAYHVVSPP